jgi:hypothetical protein
VGGGSRGPPSSLPSSFSFRRIQYVVGLGISASMTVEKCLCFTFHHYGRVGEVVVKEQDREVILKFTTYSIYNAHMYIQYV